MSRLSDGDRELVIQALQGHLLRVPHNSMRAMRVSDAIDRFHWGGERQRDMNQAAIALRQEIEDRRGAGEGMAPGVDALRGVLDAVLGPVPAMEDTE